MVTTVTTERSDAPTLVLASLPPTREQVREVTGRDDGPEAEERTRDLHCSAEWRRPGAQWVCVRRSGHHGRHRMRRRDEGALVA